MKIVLHVFFVLGLYFTAAGQRMPFFSHHVVNPYLYNPAFAGYDAHPVLYLTHRQQWLGVEGAPVSTNLSFNTPAGNANPISLGADLTYDRLGIYRYTSLKTTVAYMVPLSAEKEHYFRMGLSAGLDMNTYDLQGINTSDNALFQAAQNAGVYFNGRFGLQYHLENFNLGIALPQLSSSPLIGEETTSLGLNPFSRMIGSVSYRLRLNPEGSLSIEPTVLYHYSRDFDHQIEAIALLRLGESFWVGGGYQQQAGYASLVGFQTKRLSVGYHYGLGGNELAAISTGTHEIQLGLILGKKKATVKRRPRLSTHSDPDATAEETPKQRRRKKTPTKEADQPITPSPDNQPDTKNPTYDKESFEELEANPNNQTITLSRDQGSDEPSFATAKRIESTNPLEMEEGVYLIVGTFSQGANAEKLARQLSVEGFSAKVGYNSAKEYYYVNLMRSDESSMVLTEVRKVRKDPRFSKAWILVIE